MYVYIHTYIHTRMHAYLYVCVTMYIHTYIHIDIRVWIGSVRRRCAGTYWAMHVRSSVCISIKCINVDTNTCAYS